MFTLSVKDSFSAAHRLEDYRGKCEELHGHNFVVEASFNGERLDDKGMVVDFALLKSALKDTLLSLDHTYLNDIKYFSDRTSSSEHIAVFIFQRLREMVTHLPVTVNQVRVWESETASASYREDR